MRLILLGAPGSGKGVQAEFIVTNYRIPHISTGNILRKVVEQKTELGNEALNYMEKGLLVPDPIIFDILTEELNSSKCRNGFVLDGVPRTIPQAEMLDKIMKHKNEAIQNVIYLNVNEESLVKRLTNRRTCVACGRVYNLVNNSPRQNGKCDNCGGELIQRVDDREDTVRKRFVVYKDQTEPLLDFYHKNGLLTRIDGNRDAKDVSQEISEKLDKIKVS